MHCPYTYMPAHMFPHVYTRVCTHGYTHSRASWSTRVAWPHMSAHMSKHMSARVYTHVRTRVCTHVYTCLHTDLQPKSTGWLIDGMFDGTFDDDPQVGRVCSRCNGDATAADYRRACVPLNTRHSRQCSSRFRRVINNSNDAVPVGLYLKWCSGRSSLLQH